MFAHPSPSCAASDRAPIMARLACVVIALGGLPAHRNTVDLAVAWVPGDRTKPVSRRWRTFPWGASSVWASVQQVSQRLLPTLQSPRPYRGRLLLKDNLRL